MLSHSGNKLRYSHFHDKLENDNEGVFVASHTQYGMLKLKSYLQVSILVKERVHHVML